MVKSPMWPRDNVYSSGCWTSAAEISPGVGSDHTCQRMAAITMAANAETMPKAFVPRSIHGFCEVIADPSSKASAGYIGSVSFEPVTNLSIGRAERDCWLFAGQDSSWHSSAFQPPRNITHCRYIPRLLYCSGQR